MRARAIMVGKETLASTPGPMTVDREALEIFMKAALASEPWKLDPSLTFKPWTPHKFSKPLKIAVQWWDGVVQPHPPVTRALKEVADACAKAGMEVIDWDCETLDHRTGWEITAALYWPDGGQEALGLLEAAGETVLPLTKFIIQEQASVKNLDQHGLWDVSLRVVYWMRFRTDIELALSSQGRVPRRVCLSLDKHRSHRSRSRRDSLPGLLRRRNTPRPIPVLGIHLTLEPSRLSRSCVPCNNG